MGSREKKIIVRRAFHCRRGGRKDSRIKRIRHLLLKPRRRAWAKQVKKNTKSAIEKN